MRRLKRLLVDALLNFDSTFSALYCGSGAAVVVTLLAREPVLRPENDDDGRLKRFLPLPDSVEASAGDSVALALFGVMRKRLRPAVNPPRPRGASVVVVVVVVVDCVVVGAGVAGLAKFDDVRRR